ncbi:hypothetical protein Ahy_B04g072417 [Arachis hypogaea]|uniref:Uncharacterized protein n=1 Tax=Arachis hypogaea TaxID=3818 RepID=A0A444ZN89_ARAHY|nr:hypothetical protein Ahy_B04g072417 [Arachis hypogaea]
MEERRRGCLVATETPPPLLGLVAFAVLPPSSCCSAAKELEGSTPCHQFEGMYDFDSDDELQWLIKIEKGPLCSLINLTVVDWCHFKPQAELDRYLEASQIRERAIDRINNVIGTYESIVLYSFNLLCFIGYNPFSLLICAVPFSSRYNDLMLKIFSKHPDLFPEEFEHFDDFTIASSWERFISKIEAICRLWMADGPNNLLVCLFNFKKKLIAPQSASSVVLDAPEASRLLSAVAIAMSNSLRDYGGFLSSLIAQDLFTCPS